MWCDVRQTKPWQEIRRRFGQTWTEPLLEDWCRIPWHYGDTGIMMSPADMPRPWDKMLQLEEPHPPPQKQFKWFQENFSNHCTQRRLSNIPRVSVPGVEGVRVRLWHGVRVTSCDTRTISGPGHWHLLTPAPGHTDEGWSSASMQIADYHSQRLSRVTKLSQCLGFETCCIKHLFVYRFNDWLLTEFPLFCAFLKTSHKLLSADSQYNGCVCTNSNWG